MPRPRVIMALGGLFVVTTLTLLNSTTFYSLTVARPEYNVNMDSCGGLRTLNNLPYEAADTNDNVKNRLLRSENIYQKQLAKRDIFLADHGYGKFGFSPWAKSDGMMPWWWYFQAAFNCPHDVQRVGRFNDGGKWLCGMSVLERPSTKKCVVYSFGVNDDSSFEAEIMERTNCEVWAFDASVDDVSGEAKGNPKIHFSKIFVGDVDKVDAHGNVWRTLPTLMKENGHDWIDVLKVDIEGYEFNMMHTIMDTYANKPLPFSQLQIELHLVSDQMGTDVAAFGQFKKWFERLEAHHLRPFWSELNIIPPMVWKTDLTLSEFSFINIQGDHSLLRN
ncbi:hypothetical protein BG004_002970 [Podila humilis]|nr:hypothetical protein BG004_002970 [Podila humilis]